MIFFVWQPRLIGLRAEENNNMKLKTRLTILLLAAGGLLIALDTARVVKQTVFHTQPALRH